MTTVVDLFVSRAKANAACRYSAKLIFARLHNAMETLAVVGPIPATPEGYVIEDFGLGQVGEALEPQALETWQTCVQLNDDHIIVKAPDGTLIYEGPTVVDTRVSLKDAVGDERLLVDCHHRWDD